MDADLPPPPQRPPGFHGGLPASVKLTRFIEQAMRLDPKLTLDDIAESLGCSRASLSNWAGGRLVPVHLLFRRAIQIWTGGLIDPDEWSTPKEKRALRRVKPFPFVSQIQV